MGIKTLIYDNETVDDDADAVADVNVDITTHFKCYYRQNAKKKIQFVCTEKRKSEKKKNNTRTHLKKSLRSAKEIKYVNKNNFSCNVIINKRELFVSSSVFNTYTYVYVDIGLHIWFLFSLLFPTMTGKKLYSITIKNV